MFVRYGKRVSLIIVAALLLWAVREGFVHYRRMNGTNVYLSYRDKPRYLEIPTGCSWPQLLTLIEENRIVRDVTAFRWAAEELNYPTAVRAGRYDLSGLRSNRQLVEHLKSGRQVPVGITIRKFRRVASLATALGSRLEPDSAAFHQLLTDSLYLSGMGLQPATAISLFLPGSYSFLWNTNPESLLDSMHRGYVRFWNEERRRRAAALGLSPSEIMTLASIVDEESDRPSEFCRIAGVYLNRLRIEMPLQADPTIRFASGNDDLRRIEGAVLRIESPYNTYLYPGLPPGPVCTPSLAAIDSTLRAERHRYLYFCARADFSGFHLFARDYPAHQRNARAYQRALDNRNKP